MNERYIDDLRYAIFKMHGCKATHLETVPVHESFQGKTVWDGDVEVFEILDHPSGSKKCYSWAYQDDDGKTQYTAVLALPPVKSPRDAVKVAIVAQVKNEKT